MVGNTLSLFHILNRESYNEIETKILEKLFKIIIMSMDYFSNHVDLLNITIDILSDVMIECNDSVLEQLLFDRYKCIQIVLQSMVNFKSEFDNPDIGPDFFLSSSIIIEKILNIMKPILRLMNDSLEYMEKIFEENIIGLLFLVLNVRQNISLLNASCFSFYLLYVLGIRWTKLYRRNHVDFTFYYFLILPFKIQFNEIRIPLCFEVNTLFILIEFKYTNSNKFLTIHFYHSEIYCVERNSMSATCQQKLSHIYALMARKYGHKRLLI